MDRTPLAEYGGAMKGFHWLVVALLVVQYALGWTMPELRRGMPPEGLVNLHLSFGVAIGAIMALRLAWRVLTPQPPANSSLPRWQHRAATAVHGLLYLLVFALVLTGWADASRRGWPVTLFGILDLPALVATGSTVGRALGEVHETLVTVLLLLVGLHVAAVAAHVVLWRDRIMDRMTPRLRHRS
ncbi:cytochrome b [Nitrospirillum amazonense]|uniref:Cytochrome b561 n=1 Tax=Nitrospirillum amazonense TaxID=28077 RepID=A0A560K9X8_9PROT|nr:cytochrome b/b6 domain-containing protein [Nitrospirillum amazonense]MDG3441388.1 cytochrome b/b6 domain-containing protein [Nitrospirillum amazonense]TWB80121.1 cytochrome b561 [Nitrospirillum amazonense]